MPKKKDNTMVTFHRTFSLKRKPIADILIYANKNPETNLSQKKLVEEIKFGTIYGVAFPRYAIFAGLLSESRKGVTDIGKIIIEKDSVLASRDTQWIIHYHLSSSKRNGPPFWPYLVTNYFVIDNIFERDDVQRMLTDFHWELTETVLLDASQTSTVGAFINTYINDDGLGSLGLIKKIPETDYYQIVNPPPPSLPVLYFAIADFVSGPENNSSSTLLNLLIDSELANIFLLSPGDFEAKLDQMRARGYLDIARVSQPYTVYLKKEGRAVLAEHYGA